MALSGIDMALWDALARLHGVPLASLLGGRRHAGAGVWRDWLRWAGPFCGGRGILGGARVHRREGEDRLSHRRRRRRRDPGDPGAAGAGVAIMVDYNQSLTPADAVSRLQVLDDEGLEWVEEPTMAHDYSRPCADRP